jgi:hypothetical protein
MWAYFTLILKRLAKYGLRLRWEGEFNLNCVWITEMHEVTLL